jgi:23S rRNA pseudouridine1911/1915/1917 synthase
MLHAFQLGFIHPRTGRRLNFEAPRPEDFLDALAALRLRPQ